MKRWGIYLSFLALPILLIFCSQKSFAANSSTSENPPLSGVVLSEVQANPKGSDEDNLEFVELFNANDEPVDINGWYLSVCDTSGCSGDNIIDFIGPSDEGKYGFTTKIPSFGYALIVDPEYSGEYSAYFHQHSEWNFAMMTVESHAIGRGNIPNTAGTVKLSDGVSETSFTWTRNAGDGFSWEFDPDSGTWAPSGGYYGCSPGFDNQDPPKAKINIKNYLGKAPYAVNFGSDSYDPEGSPLTYEWNFADGTKSRSKSPKHLFKNFGTYEVVLYVWDALGLEDSDILEITVYPADIIISEVFPNPKGLDEGGEFVELYNRGHKTINLDKWQIRDSGGSGITLRDEKIKPKSYRLFTGSFYLNNTGNETVNLYYPDGKLKADSVSFSNPESGFSLALLGKDYRWTYKPTPGKANVLAQKPLSSATRYYSTSFRPSSNSYYASAYQQSKVKGITISATDKSLYPLGGDFRQDKTANSSKFSLSGRNRQIVWGLVIFALILLLFDLFYSKITRRLTRGP